jgi:broad specificity phosphatase PhoE
VRHGQASFGAADYDVLSDLGRQQAAAAGRALRDRGLRDPRVVSGGLRRQRDTAAVVAEALGTAVEPPDPRWDEYDHLALVRDHLAARPPADAAAASEALDPGAFQAALDVALARWVEAAEPEGWRRFAGGAVAALEDLAASLEGRDAVVVTSGGVIAAVAAHLLGAGAATVVALNRVTVNAGLTTVVSGRSGRSLIAFNEHAHLTGPAAGLRTTR